MSDSSSPCTASMASVLTNTIPEVAPAHVGQADLDADRSATRRKVRATGAVVEVGIAPVHDTAEFSALLIAQDPECPSVEGKPVRLVWQGQREVPGVAVGVYLDCVGLLCHRGPDATIFNPRYEIVAKKVRR
ncbi:hypothetical protein [Kocuria soli]|nr:hypothetical protein [Kocuria soli]